MRTSSTSFVTCRTIRIIGIPSSTIRVSLRGRTSSADYPMYYRIVRGGTVVVGQQEIGSTAYATYAHNITVSNGDVLTLQFKQSHASAEAVVKDVRVVCTRRDGLEVY